MAKLHLHETSYQFKYDWLLFVLVQRWYCLLTIKGIHYTYNVGKGIADGYVVKWKKHKKTLCKKIIWKIQNIPTNLWLSNCSQNIPMINSVLPCHNILATSIGAFWLGICNIHIRWTSKLKNLINIIWNKREWIIKWKAQTHKSNLKKASNQALLMLDLRFNKWSKHPLLEVGTCNKV